MSEFGIATAATDKIVLAVISHLNEGHSSRGKKRRSARRLLCASEIELEP